VGPALAVGPQLPIFDPTGTGLMNPAEAARAAEELGFDIAFVGDHLAFNPPWLECIACLAAASASTTRLMLGTSVLLAAMREPAWLAKQIATLQFLSGGRLLLGVGVGGENPAEWEAVGVPVRERGRRTDAFLEALPRLLEGRPARVGAPVDLPIPELRPAAEPPPLWIGGRSDAALRRAARFADGWLGAFVDADGVPSHRERLGELAREAGHTEAPRIGLSVFINVCDDIVRGREEAREYFEGLYRLPLERVERYCLIGPPEHVVEGLVRYVEAGVSLFTLVAVAPRPFAQYEALAAVRAALLGAVGAVPLGLGRPLGCWE
jgi:alkanesulfonate monooxygenase SsuD/methylene tetrahydromethanopterin reductase-like flavin-dependent oxidoreductase (luciferase family)